MDEDLFVLIFICTQPPGSRPQTLRVSTHGQRAAPFLEESYLSAWGCSRHILCPNRQGDLLLGDFGKAPLLVRGSSWRKPTQKIASLYLRMRSQWSMGKYHLLPLLPHPKPLGRNTHRLQNLNALNLINNHH